jgi:hypothetical protein
MWAHPACSLKREVGVAPPNVIQNHIVRTTRRNAKFAVRLKLRSRSRQTQHDCSRPDSSCAYGREHSVARMPGKYRWTGE